MANERENNTNYTIYENGHRVFPDDHFHIYNFSFAS